MTLIPTSIMVTGPPFPWRTKAPSTQEQQIKDRTKPVVAAVRKYSRTLLLGQIQGGKTSTYLGVARQLLTDKDASFVPTAVIVLAGVHHALKKQTTKRTATMLAALKEEIGDLNCEARVFLKNKKQLTDAIEFVDNLGNGVVLLIDDEADQASPNTKAYRNRENSQDTRSVVNATLVQLVEKVLCGKEDGSTVGRYLACTATPAATLLTARTDILSCDVAVVLPEHNTYYGIKEAIAHMVRLLPAMGGKGSDMYQYWTEQVLLYFCVGSALEALDETRSAKVEDPKFMLHVAAQKKSHEKCHKTLVKNIEEWQSWARPVDTNYPQGNILDTNLAKVKQVLQHFEHAYLLDDGADGKTALFWTEFQKSIDTLSSETVKLVNTDSDDHGLTDDEDDEDGEAVNQNREFKPVIKGYVGGNMLGRGITIPQLITSAFYRPIKANTPLDTIQQWARFCGPRKDYSKYSAILVTPEVREAFVEIENLEKALYEELKPDDEGACYLPDWRRAFLTSRKKLTRNVVQAIPLADVTFGAEWNPFEWFDSDIDRLKHNEAVYDKLVATFKLEQGSDRGCGVENENIDTLFALLAAFRRPAVYTHGPYLADVPNLLKDAKKFVLYLPGPKKQMRGRMRDDKTEEGPIKQLFSEGERKVRADAAVTLHIRRIQPKGTEVVEVMGALYVPYGYVASKTIALEAISQ